MYASTQKLDIQVGEIGNVLTRSSGYLKTVTSHSLQPYRGCPLGRSLCGVGCYVQHNPWVTAGRSWGSFLEARQGAGESYLANVQRERRWARRQVGTFGVYLSSSTEPFPPQEGRFGATRGVLEAMLAEPPDLLVVQSHSHRAADFVELFVDLGRRCELRVHLSIETDRERLPGLPPHASPVKRRIAAAAAIRNAGVRTVVTVSPLLPIAAPDPFFASLKEVADAVVIDHFIGGDGTVDGRRTLRTALPEAMAQVEPTSIHQDYRQQIIEVAQRHFGRAVGVSIDGFAGRFKVQDVVSKVD